MGRHVLSDTCKMQARPHLVRAQPLDKLNVLGAAHAGHVQAQRLGELACTNVEAGGSEKGVSVSSSGRCERAAQQGQLAQPPRRN